MLVYAANFNLKNIDVFGFIDLAIEWVTNKNSYYDIPPFKWNEEEEQIIKSSDGKLEFTIYVLIEKDTVAIKLENIDESGIKWVNEYSLVENQLYVQLQKYSTDINDELYVSSQFNLPYLLKMLFQRDKVQEHPIFNNNGYPTFIDKSNSKIITDLINNKTKYDLPVVYISKNISIESYYPYFVNYSKLSKTLMGIAYVAIEKDLEVSQIIRESTNWKNPYDGAIQIFFNNGYSKRLLKEHFESEKLMRKKVFDIVFNRTFRIQKEDKFSLSYIANEIYNTQIDNLKNNQSKLKLLQSELELCHNRINILKNENEQYKSDIYTYQTKCVILQEKIDRNDDSDMLSKGKLDDLYDNEVFDCIYDTISEMLCNYVNSESRQNEILTSILETNKNKYTNSRKAKIEQFKQYAYNAKGATKRFKNNLTNMGLEVYGDNHPKIRFPKGKQIATLGSTPSDSRSADNSVTEFKKLF